MYENVKKLKNFNKVKLLYLVDFKIVLNFLTSLRKMFYFFYFENIMILKLGD